MPVLTFRINVPATTPAKIPITLDLNSQASAIQEILIWSPTSTLDLLACGFRLSNRMGGTILPEMGSHDNFTFVGSDEDAWAPIPPTPQRIEMSHQVIEGPPYLLRFSFYNTDAAAIEVGCFVIVGEPMIRIAHDAMLYEFLTSRPGGESDASPQTRTQLGENKGAKK